MAVNDAVERVQQFLDEKDKLSPESINQKLAEIKTDIYELVNRLEQLHAISPDYQQVSFSDNINEIYNNQLVNAKGGI